jgi:hypothetical protein
MSILIVKDWAEEEGLEPPTRALQRPALPTELLSKAGREPAPPLDLDRRASQRARRRIVIGRT